MKINLPRYFYWTLALFLLIFTFNSLSEELFPQKGLLWQIEKPGVKPSYLFGTMHSENPRVTRLLSIVKPYIAKVDQVSLETELNIAAILKSSIALFLEPGQTLDQLMDKTQYTQLIKVLYEHDIPEDFAKTLKPWAIMIILSTPRAKKGNVLDLLLYQEAQAQNKKISGLETVEEQLDVFEGIPFADQLTLLQEALNQLDEMSTIFEEMLDLYTQRDLSGLLAFSKKYMSSETNQALANSFKKRILDDRNIRMVERMRPHLHKGNAFIAVGALHLPGKNGILKLLEKQGYKLSLLY